MKNKLSYILFLLLGCISSCQFVIAQIRVIDNKGTVSTVDPSKWTLNITTNDICTKYAGKVGIGTTIPGATLHNTGSTILGMTTASNTAATYTVSAAMVDGFSGLVITQTSSAAAVMLTTPTTATAGRRFTLTNNASSAFSLTVGNYTIPVGASGEFVWNGSVWSAPSTVATIVPFNGLINATAANTVDNTTQAQTWGWTTATTQNPLTVNANALTEGTLLGLNADALTSGNGLVIASTGADLTGSLLSATSDSFSEFTDGGVHFNFTGDHAGNGFQIDDATTTGAAMSINANSLTNGSALTVSSSSAGLTTAGSNVGLLLNATTSGNNSGFTGTLAEIGLTSVTGNVGNTGTVLSLDDNATTANDVKLLTMKSASKALTQGFLFNSASTANAIGLVDFNFTGNHTGNGFQIDDATTTGNAMQINVKGARTAGSGLYISSTGSTALPSTTSAAGITIAMPSASRTSALRYIRFTNAAGTEIGYIRNATTSSVSLVTTSDRRLKSNLRVSSFGITDLMKIGVRDYNWKNDGAADNGFIAQDLYKVYPYAVSKGDDGEDYIPGVSNTWSVDYGRITPLIIKSVQDQQKIIESQKQQIQSQQLQIDELRKLVDLLVKKSK
jgi:hypothetical protein